MKLNQLIAITNGKKSQAEKCLSRIYHILKKEDRFSGLERNYQPINDEGTKFPPESKRVQSTVKEDTQEVREHLTDMMNCVVSQDAANQEAKADVVVGSETVLEAVPVTSLIFLEKQLVNLRTFVGSLPTLDRGETWTYDPNSELYRSEKNTTTRTEKVKRPVVLYDATEHHPAQTEMVTEDIVAGYWHTQKLSGAITEAEQKDLLQRVETLREAVVKARELANSIDAKQREDGDKVFKFLFG